MECNQPRPRPAASGTRGVSIFAHLECVPGEPDAATYLFGVSDEVAAKGTSPLAILVRRDGIPQREEARVGLGSHGCGRDSDASQWAAATPSHVIQQFSLIH